MKDRENACSQYLEMVAVINALKTQGLFPTALRTLEEKKEELGKACNESSTLTKGMHSML